MLQKLRERFTGKFAVVILALICVPFAFFGITNYRNFLGGDFAAKVEGVKISRAELENAVQQTITRYAEQGSDIPPELQGIVRQAVLTNLIRDKLIDVHLSDEGYRVTDQMIADFIRQVPEFQENGKFSKQRYYDWLQSQGVSALRFEESRRQAMRLSQFQRGIAATAFVTPAQYRRYLNLYGEQRRAAIATFDTGAAAENVELTEEEIAGYYDEHPDEFQAPESVDLAYIEIDRRELAQDVDVGEQELRSYYDRVSDRYRRDEQRQARHILISFGDDEAAAKSEATALAERARAGEPFEDLARQYSDDGGTKDTGGDLGTVLKSQMPGPLGDTIFSMKKGEIAGPVRSEFGFHIVRLDDIQPGGPLPLADVRSEVEGDLRDEKAA
ncbi:MAG TPA: SurA N-terminal domain-containing protein, partial [Woeseiaceae bacterium]|nr:SurA N-terminal domain-containing protein [Woeseiaceae bacterium]